MSLPSATGAPAGLYNQLRGGKIPALEPTPHTQGAVGQGTFGTVSDTFSRASLSGASGNLERRGPLGRSPRGHRCGFEPLPLGGHSLIPLGPPESWRRSHIRGAPAGQSPRGPPWLQSHCGLFSALEEPPGRGGDLAKEVAGAQGREPPTSVHRAPGALQERGPGEAALATSGQRLPREGSPGVAPAPLRLPRRTDQHQPVPSGCYFAECFWQIWKVIFTWSCHSGTPKGSSQQGSWWPIFFRQIETTSGIKHPEKAQVWGPGSSYPRMQPKSAEEGRGSWHCPNPTGLLSRGTCSPRILAGRVLISKTGTADSIVHQDRQSSQALVRGSQQERRSPRPPRLLPPPKHPHLCPAPSEVAPVPFTLERDPCSWPACAGSRSGGPLAGWNTQAPSPSSCRCPHRHTHLPWPLWTVGACLQLVPRTHPTLRWPRGASGFLDAGVSPATCCQGSAQGPADNTLRGAPQALSSSMPLGRQ